LLLAGCDMLVQACRAAAHFGAISAVRRRRGDRRCTDCPAAGGSLLPVWSVVRPPVTPRHRMVGVSLGRICSPSELPPRSRCATIWMSAGFAWAADWCPAPTRVPALWRGLAARQTGLRRECAASASWVSGPNIVAEPSCARLVHHRGCRSRGFSGSVSSSEFASGPPSSPSQDKSRTGAMALLWFGDSEK